MNANRRLWWGLGALLVVSFSVLLWVGTEIHRVMPPIPARVVTENGELLYTRADIEKGRQVWQVRQQVKVGGAYLVSGGSSRPVWEWVDEGSDRDREHQWQKRLEQMRASTANQQQEGQ